MPSTTTNRDELHPTVDENKRIASAFLQAIATGDLAAIEQLLHPDLVWWVLGFGELSRREFTASLAATIASSSERSVTINGLTAEANRVAIEASGSFKMPTTVYQNTYHYLFVIEAGRIILGKEYLDTVEATRVFKKQ